VFKTERTFPQSRSYGYNLDLSLFLQPYPHPHHPTPRRPPPTPPRILFYRNWPLAYADYRMQKCKKGLCMVSPPLLPDKKKERKGKERKGKKRKEKKRKEKKKYIDYSNTKQG
jgi:hypothetical protein